MSTAPVEYGDHPVVAAAARIHAELDELVDTAVWSMTPAVLARTLPALTKAKARVAEVELRVVQQAERVGLGTEVGASDTTAWWANTTRMTKGEAHRLAKLATSLDFAHEPVRDSLATGGLLVDQAQVIVDAVDALPDDLVSAEVAAQAEAHLIGLAVDYDAKALRMLGRKVLDVIAPQIGEEHERRILEAQEASARKGARFTMGEDGHGQCHGRFTISSLHGAMLKKALLAIAAPKHQAATAATGHAAPLGARVPAPLRMGQAFSEFIENYPTDHLPNAGGVAATVVVTIDLQALTDGLGAATTDLGVDLSASEARRLACEAGILPVVLSGKFQPLDIGRKTRFHTTAQRIALGIRDKGCTAVGCDWPPGMCPPPDPLAPRRPHQHQQRPPALPPTPLLRPQPHLRDDRRRQRQSQLPPKNIRALPKPTRRSAARGPDPSRGTILATARMADRLPRTSATSRSMPT